MLNDWELVGNRGQGTGTISVHFLSELDDFTFVVKTLVLKKRLKPLLRA